MFLNTDCTDYTDKLLRRGDLCYLWDSCLSSLTILENNSLENAFRNSSTSELCIVAIICLASLGRQGHLPSSPRNRLAFQYALCHTDY